MQLAHGEWIIRTLDEAARLRARAAETRDVADRISLRCDRDALLRDAQRLEDAALRLERSPAGHVVMDGAGPVGWPGTGQAAGWRHQAGEERSPILVHLLGGQEA